MLIEGIPKFFGKFVQCNSMAPLLSTKALDSPSPAALKEMKRVITLRSLGRIVQSTISFRLQHSNIRKETITQTCNNNEGTISPPGIYSAGGALFCNLAIPAENADTLPIGHGHASQGNQLLHQQQQ